MAQDKLDDPDLTSFGVFKPVGHVVLSFPSADDAAHARQALGEVDLAPDAIQAVTDDQMLAQVEAELARASPVAAIGVDLNLRRYHGELARRGFHFLVVKADNDEQASRIARIAQRCNAERAQHYGHFIIEELINPDPGRNQVAESPDRGLDAYPKPPLPR